MSEGKLKFTGKGAFGETRYEVWRGDEKIGEVYTPGRRSNLWGATDGERTWSAGTRQRAAEFLLSTQPNPENKS